MEPGWFSRHAHTQRRFQGTYVRAGAGMRQRAVDSDSSARLTSIAFLGLVFCSSIGVCTQDQPLPLPDRAAVCARVGSRHLAVFWLLV